jgi:hypothetical protein
MCPSLKACVTFKNMSEDHPLLATTNSTYLHVSFTYVGHLLLEPKDHAAVARNPLYVDNNFFNSL